MKIVQPKISGKHNDSIWYDGLIAETEHYQLFASGDVRINRIGADGSYKGMYDGKARDDFWEIENDDDLARIYDNTECYVDMNNWFEIVEKDNDELGEVYDSYDDGIKILKDLEKEYV